jgi:hypothetical protein
MSKEVGDAKHHTYEYAINLEGETGPAKVVRFVGREKKVLELGTGPGSITQHFFTEGQCKVTGIEMDAEAIEMVRPFCEVVHRGDLNDPEWPRLVADCGGFDVVVAADVLEHLYQPWETLAAMKGLLNDAGSIVVSLPHVGHCSIAACLMAEDFSYMDWGLLDRTHIRFFGIHNIQSLFDDAGLKIVRAEFVITPPEKSEFSVYWGQLPESVQRGLLENPFATVYQVIIRAVPVDAQGEAIQLVDIPVEKRVPVAPYADSNTAMKSSVDDVSLIAFYLPQYHPIPENDLWWGKGFTEWSNVTKAMPLFSGQYQPHLPADLGFYDLRLRDIHHEQIAMAKKYGIDGFCYHYYWFSGKRLLDRPVDDMLADKEADMPFCLCWANENWTRRWDAAEHEVLISQEYRPEDDLEFIKSVIPFFRDSRYIHKDGKPFLIVYRPQHLPDAKKSVRIWRNYCKEQGFEGIHVCCALTHGNTDYEKFGFDSGVEFPPHNSNVNNINDRVAFDAPFEGNVMPFHWIADSYLGRHYDHNNVFKTVFPSWDNTARTHSRAFIMLNGTPANYEYWLAETIRHTKISFPDEQRFVFLNAWNEWAEGCHLEPDQRYGHQFLEATYRAKKGISQKYKFEDVMIPDPLHEPDSPEMIAAIKDQLDFVRAERDAFRDEIGRIHTSTSWKFGSPVRVLARLRQRLAGVKSS